MSEQEKQEQPQGQSQPQGSDKQQDKSPAAAESPAAEKQPGAPEATKIRGCFDDIQTGEGTGARGGEYS